ncbi:MAG: hypothetical protein JXB88_15540 [Spirochaetales bacterium]|nr:hypothetical protein [Spirochaetales bacterium]
MPDVVKLKQDLLKNGSLSDAFRNQIAMLPDDSALELFTEIINEYNEHNNLFLAVQLSTEIMKRKAIKYLNVLYNLKERIVSENVALSLKQRLHMNIELLELEANTDIDRIVCPCSIYSRYNEHPENCPGLTIVSEDDQGGGYVYYVVYKVKCNTCGRRWKIKLQETSAHKMSLSWSMDFDDAV